MSVPLLGIDPASFTAVSDLSAPGGGFVLGQVYYEPSTGKWYRFVYNADSGTISAADVICWFDTTPAFGHVQSATGTTGMDNGTAGVFAGLGVATIATLKYGFLQVGGPFTAMTTTGNVTKGAQLVVNGGTSPDKTADAFADGEEECVFGIALEDDTSTTLAKGYLFFRG